MKWKCRDCHIGSTASVALSTYRLNVPSAKTLFLPHYCSCISIRFRQRWKSAALHMKWKCRDCHIGFAASVTLSAYRLECRAPKTIHALMNFVFSHAIFSHISVNFGRNDSLRHSIWNGSTGTAISALEPVWYSPPIIRCVKHQKLFIFLWISFLVTLFFAHFIWILTRENAASFFRIDTSVLVVVLSTSASAASFVRIDTSTPVRHFSMSPRKTFRLFHKTFEFNVLR